LTLKIGERRSLALNSDFDGRRVDVERGDFCNTRMADKTRSPATLILRTEADDHTRASPTGCAELVEAGARL
jgi:hypothetical protein